jgi:hypothetical protein
MIILAPSSQLKNKPDKSQHQSKALRRLFYGFRCDKHPCCDFCGYDTVYSYVEFCISEKRTASVLKAGVPMLKINPPFSTLDDGQFVRL